MLRWITITSIFFLLLGCAMAGSLAITPTVTIVATPTLEPSPTFTPAPPTEEPCGYAWANQSLPEISANLSQAFADANLTGVLEARASAYGENCVTASGQVQSFHAMYTDFYLTIAVEDTEDASVMGEWVEKVFPVLDRFPPGEVPGPNLGYVGIRFTGGGSEKNLWFRQQTARDLLQQDKRGAALFEALGSP